jgi:acetyltransferase-like isoleucine patch superfamily enzyme
VNEIPGGWQFVLRAIRRLLFGLVDFLLPDFRGLERLRGAAGRRILGFKSATGLRLLKGVDFGSGFDGVTIGPNCYIGSRCVFYAENPATISIGENVWIGIESVFWCGSHEIGDRRQRCGAGTLSSIAIGDGAWIGLRCVIRADVGPGSIVNAAALVVKPVPAHVIAQGVPAKVFRELD